MEPSQILEFIEPESQNVYEAKSHDLIKVYADECNSTIKQTKLSHAALYPTNFEKQKVQLVCNVFNEKTVVALELQPPFLLKW